jgi:hypothetical protein
MTMSPEQIIDSAFGMVGEARAVGLKPRKFVIGVDYYQKLMASEFRYNTIDSHELFGIPYVVDPNDTECIDVCVNVYDVSLSKKK